MLKLEVSLGFLFLLFATSGLVHADADAEAEADPEAQVGGMSQSEAGCGPPRLLSRWDNMTVEAGERAVIKCPLDTRNTCLVDWVEWYYSSYRLGTGPRRVIRDLATSFDPLLLYLNDAGEDQSGWYICVVGNSEGRSEISTYLDVQRRRRVEATTRRPRPRPLTRRPYRTTTTTPPPPPPPPPRQPTGYAAAAATPNWQISAPVMKPVPRREWESESSAPAALTAPPPPPPPPQAYPATPASSGGSSKYASQRRQASSDAMYVAWGGGGSGASSMSSSTASMGSSSGATMQSSANSPIHLEPVPQKLRQRPDPAGAIPSPPPRYINRERVKSLAPPSASSSSYSDMALVREHLNDLHSKVNELIDRLGVVEQKVRRIEGEY